MGFAISWLTISGKAPEQVLKELRLNPHRRERGDSRVTNFCSPAPQQLVPRLRQRVRLANSFREFAGQPFHKLQGCFLSD